MIKPLSPEILKAKVAIFCRFTFKNTKITGSSRTTKKNTDLIQEKLLSEYTISLIERVMIHYLQ
jgi:hypothetical protein